MSWLTEPFDLSLEIINKKNNGTRREKSKTPVFRPIYVVQIPNKNLGVHVNVFANKLKVAQHLSETGPECS